MSKIINRPIKLIDLYWHNGIMITLFMFAFYLITDSIGYLVLGAIMFILTHIIGRKHE